jgi:hypothetical protein
MGPRGSKWKDKALYVLPKLHRSTVMMIIHGASCVNGNSPTRTTYIAAAFGRRPTHTRYVPPACGPLRNNKNNKLRRPSAATQRTTTRDAFRQHQQCLHNIVSATFVLWPLAVQRTMYAYNVRWAEAFGRRPTSAATQRPHTNTHNKFRRPSAAALQQKQ